MDYISTRCSSKRVESSAAILSGIAPDGGLYTPASIPGIHKSHITYLRTKSYEERAAWLLGSFLTDFTPEELSAYTGKAYHRFDTRAVAPVVPCGDYTYILELFHGPTCAFKDMALQILPYLLTASIKKCGVSDEITILVATSGDTGKAALEGFADVDGTRIMVFYPENGVSEIQKLQMVTQTGQNVAVCAVQGNFDDAQTGVKRIFADAAFAHRLAEKGIRLSSANSINWGRLVPQIVYYVSAYCDLLNQGAIADGEKINICVPTGNFGNILAAYLAKRMGLPVARLICASNANNVLTEFLQTGCYNARRPFFTTASPSMDILVSSNVERLLFELSEHNGEAVNEMMQSLAANGSYKVPDLLAKRLTDVFSAGWCDDQATLDCIRRYYQTFRYLPDTHTAVALSVLDDYRQKTGDQTPTVVASTASPFKFAPDVLHALTGEPCADHANAADRLSELTGISVPEPIRALAGKPVRFTDCVGKAGMLNKVSAWLIG
ncbi:MAG: threonine synthase [Clostridiales bacterium]|nr:threonine synthase [Clostridiales bacterium]MDD7309937.1 threonine synthase [Eubacteriales bacterium]MDY5346282.1 threonine synthase [Eubacteriales bacterium]